MSRLARGRSTHPRPENVRISVGSLRRRCGGCTAGHRLGSRVIQIRLGRPTLRCIVNRCGACIYVVSRTIRSHHRSISLRCSLDNFFSSQDVYSFLGGCTLRRHRGSRSLPTRKRSLGSGSSDVRDGGRPPSLLVSLDLACLVTFPCAGGFWGVCACRRLAQRVVSCT
eukprot:scaffold22045_cov111-Isochrysis_galbana.AAC.2